MSTAGSPPPLVARAAANDLGGVTSLLTARPAMDAVNEETLDTALHCAARNRNVDMMRALLSAGADPTLRNRACETPLAICIAADHAEAVNTLLEHGAARALFVHGWRNDALLFTVPRDTPATPARAAIMRAVDEALEVFVRDLPTETSAEAEAAVISCPFDFASAASTASGAGAAAPGVTAAAAAGHQGSWRGPDRRFYCSIAGQVDGPLCEHGGGINREHHYSCCGATSASAPCTAAGRRAGAGGASGGASGSSGHSGEYRDVDSGRLTRYCSLRSDREGMLCAHSAGIVRSSHWSCCGARSRDAACTAGAGAGASASSAGATGGGEGLGHSGAFRRDPRRFYCSKPGAQAEGPLCEHGSAIVRAEHWSCCGVTAASGRCTRPGAPAAGAAAPTPHAATSTPASAAAAGASGARHTGSWRGTGKTRFCSLATDRDGPVCMHINPGPIVPDDHWSCCGAKTQTGPCLFALPPAFSVGDRVVRGPTWKWGDQDGTPGNTGTITTARCAPGWVAVTWDRSSSSNSYRYNPSEGHLDVIPAVAAPAAGSGHGGTWRSDPERQRCCSLPYDRDGPLCTHSADGAIVRDPHWSCCGLTSRTAGCTAPAAPAASGSSSGAHSGPYRDASRTRCCSLPDDRDGPLCTHDGGIVAAEHWACCGVTERSAPCSKAASVAAVAASAAAAPVVSSGAHSGVWRGDERTRCCSLPDDRDGPLCTHDGGIVADAHYTCCGVVSREAPCRASATATAAAGAAGAEAFSGQADVSDADLQMGNQSVEYRWGPWAFLGGSSGIVFWTHEEQEGSPRFAAAEFIYGSNGWLRVVSPATDGVQQVLFNSGSLSRQTFDKTPWRDTATRRVQRVGTADLATALTRLVRNETSVESRTVGPTAFVVRQCAPQRGCAVMLTRGGRVHTEHVGGERLPAPPPPPPPPMPAPAASAAAPAIGGAGAAPAATGLAGTAALSAALPPVRPVLHRVQSGELEDDGELRGCNVCMDEILRTAVISPCGHVLCESCILHYAAEKLLGDRSVAADRAFLSRGLRPHQELPCPMCRTNMRLDSLQRVTAGDAPRSLADLLGRRDRGGNSALHIAGTLGLRRTFHALQRAGASLEEANKEGRTAAQLYEMSSVGVEAGSADSAGGGAAGLASPASEAAAENASAARSNSRAKF